MENEQAQIAGHRKNVNQLTHFDVQDLSRFVSETGKILSREYTRLTAKDQRRITTLIKRARNMLLMK